MFNFYLPHADPLLSALQELDVIEVVEHFTGGHMSRVRTFGLETCLEERRKN